jgi:UDP-2-acetamido-2,6-beta-L-arabino-hexul-4-ose reductase
MIKVGVTGSNGFIGWHLCRTLELDSNKFSVIEFKRDWFSNDAELDLFVSQCSVIIHLAGLNRHSDEEAIYSTNIELTNKLIQSFNRTAYKGHIIFSSSIQEERNNVFGNSKKVSRELFTNWAIDSGANFKGLIIPNVFGAFGVPFYNSVISTFCHQLVNYDKPKIENDSVLNLIYINDLVKIIIELIDVKSIETIKIEHSDSCKVSELLEILTNFKLKYFEKGQIPNFKNKFELNLFNTFRSYFDLNSHYPQKHVNAIDDRGNFVEMVRLESGGQVSFSTTKTGITRGNHFHTRKVERFSVIKGKARIQLRKIGTNEVYEYNLSGDEPAYVDMPIWYAHNIKNIGEDDLYTMFWINEFYDPSDSDTYFQEV